MERYKIIIYSLAQKDLIEITEYINTLSPKAALNHYDEIVNKIETLSSLPARCPLLKNNNLISRGYRGLIVENFLVIFVIKNQTVQIRRILYGGRNYEFLM